MRNKMTAEEAASIVNDIHEGMCRASRKKLMECASYFSIRASELYQEASLSYGETATHALQRLADFRKRNNDK